VANFVNLTAHSIRLNDGTIYEPSGSVARVSSSHSDFDHNGIASVVFGDVSGLPDPQPDTYYVVSGLVAAAARRLDVVSPASGQPETVRENGQIVSVPGFIRG